MNIAHLLSNYTEKVVEAENECRIACELFESVDEKKAILYLGKGYIELSKILSQQEKYDEALEKINTVLYRYPMDSDDVKGKVLIADALEKRGRLYVEMRKIKNALEDFLEACTIREEIARKRGYTNDILQLAATLTNLAGVYRAEGDNEKAGYYYKKAINILPETMDFMEGNLEAWFIYGWYIEVLESVEKNSEVEKYEKEREKYKKKMANQLKEYLEKRKGEKI